MRRERSISLNPSALSARGGAGSEATPPTTSAEGGRRAAGSGAAAAGESGSGADGGSGSPATKNTNTLEQIVVNTFRTFVQVVVQARSPRSLAHGHDTPAAAGGAGAPHLRQEVFSPEASTWLNYYLDCLWVVDEDLTRFWREWKRNERRNTIDMTLDVIAHLPSGTPAHPPTTRSRPTSLQHQRDPASDLQPFLLERWQFSFNAKPVPEAKHNTINVKKTAMVLRSVGSVVRVLPSHKLVRLRRKQPTSFSIDYALYPTAPAHLSMPSVSQTRYDWADAASKQILPFSSVVSRHGTFTVTVEYATNLPSFKFQALKIEPFVITDYVPSEDDDISRHKGAFMADKPFSDGDAYTSSSTKDIARTSDHPRDDVPVHSTRRKSLERGTSLPVFLPSDSPMQQAVPSLATYTASPSTRTGPPSLVGTQSSAIPIRSTNHSRMPRGGRSIEDDGELGMMMGTSASPPKLSPTILYGGLVSPSAGDVLSRSGAVGSVGKGSSNVYNFSSTPPFTRDFFLQGYGQGQPSSSQPRSSPAHMHQVSPGISPFLEEKSPVEAGVSSSRSLETSGSYTEAIFPTLLPPEDVSDIPDLYTNFHSTQPAFAVAIQENEVSTFLDACARPPELKMFNQPKNMVASFADELRSLGAEGAEELETLSRSLRRLSTDMGKSSRAPGKGSVSRDNLDDPLFFDM